ncbi:polyamine ABC transporter substrate-binding protein [Mycolicibacterium stellerae]|uniref:polyamine ABC transporter substrate-binding protein n=1 Tax=Mycolicibacterium stellerae TaxID=2358193 RepID=UPI000F0B0BCF|nr:spermidine/putrescine ABC transporter substrate-binding protein [Mycolicibacterium stellerae]
MTPGIDLNLAARLASNRTSRRRFIGGSAAAAAAAVLGPAFLAACSKDSGGGGEDVSDSLRISNWPAYMAPDFVKGFQDAESITVDYKEDLNDNEEWFAKVKEPLQRKQDIGADLAVPTTFMAVRLQQLGFLSELNHANIPNIENLRPDLLEASVDPGRKFSAPYMSGFVGIGYNRAATGRDIKSIDDLWDPAFKGRVSLFSDTQDALGMIMMSQGSSIDKPDEATVQKAIDLVKEEKDKGQIRRFTGNDYLDDLAAGNLVVAQAYSGDVVQLQADNPDVQFIIPESGGTTFVDTMVIPYTTQHQDWAEKWINYIYDRANYAKLVSFVQYIPVLSGMTEELEKVDPDSAKNPLINPPADMLAKAKGWPALTDEQLQKFNTAYAAVTGA